MVKALKIIGIIALLLVIIALLVYFLVLCYPKLSENPKEGKWYRVTSDEAEDSEGNGYHAFFQKGMENKALIYFAGGGVSINEEMACVPQFDTMHPSVSLGAFFNDRNFRHQS